MSITNSMVCTVNKLNADLASIISYFKPIFLTHKTKIPIKNRYKTLKNFGNKNCQFWPIFGQNFENLKNLLKKRVKSFFGFEFVNRPMISV